MQGSANEWLLTPEKDKSWIVDHSAVTAADDDDDEEEDDCRYLYFDKYGNFWTSKI